jgi:CheY-like chemotaxis protein
MVLKRALVVDDSKVARVTLQKQLEAHNLAVEMAVSGEEALDFLKSHMVDVVFMDHEMPGMNGLEAVKAIKSNPRTATIPVMMYTAKGGELYVSQARALGAVDLLPKQTEPGVLFNMLLRLGLVTDRRNSATETDSDEDAAETADTKARDTERDEKPVGMKMSG